jgi:hypothetical protein
MAGLLTIACKGNDRSGAVTEKLLVLSINHEIILIMPDC